MARRRRLVDPNKPDPWPFIGMGAMAALAFVYFYAVVIVPWWVFLLLLIVYAVLFLQATIWWTPKPKGILGLAGGGFALWLVVVIGGAVAFGWEPRWDPGPGGKIPDELSSLG